MLSCTDPSNNIFDAYIDSFVIEAKKRGIDISTNVSINFGSIPKGKSGSAKTTFFGNKLITINERTWQLQNENERTFLIYHELGHALLNRPHKNDLLATGQCARMMHEAVDIDCVCDKYSRVWQNYYLDKLFELEAKAPTELYLPHEVDSIIVSENTSKHFNPGYEQWGYIGDSYQLEKHSYSSIHVSYLELPNLRMEQLIIEWNGIKVKYDPTISQDFTISSDHAQKKRTYYRLHLPGLTFPLDFKFVRHKDMVYCFLKGQVVHVLDYALFTMNNKIQTAQGMSEYSYAIKIESLQP